MPIGSVERRCLIVLTGLAIFYTFYFTRAILLPTTLAVMLSLVLKPVTNRLHRWGLPNMLAAMLILTAFCIATLLGARALWEPTAELMGEAPKSLKVLGEELRDLATPLQQIKDAQTKVADMTAVSGEVTPLEVRIKQPALSSEMLNSTGGFATGVVITVSLLFFLLSAGDHFMVKTVEVMPTWREKRDVVVLLQDLQSKVSTYLGAITLINIGLGVVIGFGMWAIGMPNPLLWGVLAALFNYIPFAGLVLGSGLVFLAAMAELPTLGEQLMAPAIYLGANGIEANLVTPAVLGRSISLNPVVILLSVFVGGWVWGIGGIFLAVPMLLVLKIACDHYRSLQPIGVFLSS
ncbi:AI-2E family transporter [Posidoniimonas polymericola]|uniref:AI-2E family transporter n=1 Tax=Posidoniimonas polymericola TaxID=2528002 RepID=UPI0018D38EF1|nr:AI-2E family transporter [Posidoniimonas polymericola]